jgi:CheY-like chemotaxis protein
MGAQTFQTVRAVSAVPVGCNVIRQTCAPPGEGRTALVADDDDDMRVLLATILRGVGFEVLEARDGEQLVELFATLWASGDSERWLVVSDIGMPVRDGLEATRMLRSKAPGLPVILVTAFSDLATLRAAQEVGATSVLIKPVDRVSFVQAALQAVEPALD